MSVVRREKAKTSMSLKQRIALSNPLMLTDSARPLVWEHHGFRLRCAVGVCWLDTPLWFAAVGMMHDNLSRLMLVSDLSDRERRELRRQCKLILLEAGDTKREKSFFKEFSIQICRPLRTDEVQQLPERWINERKGQGHGQ